MERPTAEREPASLGDARHAILTQWQPSPLGGSAHESAMMGLWDEIARVAGVRAWTAVSALSGQVLELLLLDRIAAQAPETLSRRPRGLAKLARIIEENGLLLRGAPVARRSTILDVSRRLRNWASHGAFDRKGLTELDATQAMTLLVACAEALRNKPPPLRLRKTNIDAVPWYGRWSEMAPHPLLGSIMASRSDAAIMEVVHTHLDGISQHMAEYGSAKTILRFNALVRNAGWRRDALRDALVTRFVDVLTRLVWTSPERIRGLVQLFRSLGLRPHSQLLALLLPIDQQALLETIASLSPHRSARYVGEFATANGPLFREIAATMVGNPGVARVIWRDFDGTSSFVNNRQVLLSRFPASVRADVWGRAPPDALAIAIEGGTMRAMLSLVSMLLNARRGEALHDVLSQAKIGTLALARVESAVPAELRNVPWLLSRFGIINSALGHNLVRAAVASVRRGDDPIARRRVLWDAFQLLPSLRSHIVSEVCELIEKVPISGDYYALRGILCVAGETLSTTVPRRSDTPDLEAFDSWSANATSFDAALAVVGWHEGALDAPKPPALTRIEELAARILESEAALETTRVLQARLGWLLGRG